MDRRELRARVDGLNLPSLGIAAERLGLTRDGLLKQLSGKRAVSRQTELLLGYVEKELGIGTPLQDQVRSVGELFALERKARRAAAAVGLRARKYVFIKGSCGGDKITSWQLYDPESGEIVAGGGNEFLNADGVIAFCRDWRETA